MSEPPAPSVSGKRREIEKSVTGSLTVTALSLILHGDILTISRCFFFSFWKRKIYRIQRRCFMVLDRKWLSVLEPSRVEICSLRHCKTSSHFHHLFLPPVTLYLIGDAWANTSHNNSSKGALVSVTGVNYVLSCSMRARQSASLAGWLLFDLTRTRVSAASLPAPDTRDAL